MWTFQFKFSSIFIPRYLKYFVLQSLFLLNSSLKSVLQGLCLVLKSIASVFATFNAILFAFSQFFQVLVQTSVNFRNCFLYVKQTRIICKVKRVRRLWHYEDNGYVLQKEGDPENRPLKQPILKTLYYRVKSIYCYKLLREVRRKPTFGYTSYTIV